METVLNIIKSFIPSKYQKAVFDFIVNGVGNAVINAVAGSGKSTTIVQGMKLIPDGLKVLFLAFNKRIVEELIVKVNDPSKTIQTLNALGHRAVVKAYGRVTVDVRKYTNYVNNGFKNGLFNSTRDLSDFEFGVYRDNIYNLVNYYRVNNCKTVSDLTPICEKFNLIIMDNEFEIVERAIRWGLNETKTIDFVDQLFFPVAKNWEMEKYDFIMIDECQDLSAVQRELFLKSLAANGRFIAVGDPHQAIYGFAGADADSFQQLQAIPNTITLPLSVCYRCGSDIVERAKTLVPQIESKDNAPKGVIDEKAKLADVVDGDMVLCRNTAPLVRLCMQYISQSVKAYVVGRDIGANLITLIKKTNKPLTIDVLNRLSIDLSELGQKIIAKTGCEVNDLKDMPSYALLRDKIECIEVIASGLKFSTQAIDRIEVIFKDDQKSGIALSTVHKAKGLESDNVYIICPNKFYNKRSMKKEWSAQQEKNLVYVAYTRPKNKLGFISDFECK